MPAWKQDNSFLCTTPHTPSLPTAEGDLGVGDICSCSQGSFARQCAESITGIANASAHMWGFYLGSTVGKAESLRESEDWRVFFHVQQAALYLIFTVPISINIPKAKGSNTEKLKPYCHAKWD